MGSELSLVSSNKDTFDMKIPSNNSDDDPGNLRPSENYVMKTSVPNPITRLLQKLEISENSPSQDLTDNVFITAHKLLQIKRKNESFTTGCNNIDDLLLVPEYYSYGIRLGEIYEFFGPSRVGKSQFCHQIAVTVQLPQMLGGIQKKAIYIDTESTFSPSRIVQITNFLATKFESEINPRRILANIILARPNSVDEMIEIAHNLTKNLGNWSENIGLIIIDSLTSYFRSDYPGRGLLADRQQILNHYLHIIQRIANTHNIAVVVTNQVMSDPTQFLGNHVKPVGGHIMGHWATHRFSMSIRKDMQRLVRIEDSPVFPELETLYEISTNGIISPESKTIEFDKHSPF